MVLTLTSSLEVLRYQSNGCSVRVRIDYGLEMSVVIERAPDRSPKFKHVLHKDQVSFGWWLGLF